MSSTGVAAGLGVLIGAMLPIVPPPGPGDLLTPAILGGLMAKSSTSKKRKPNPAIGDPVELLSLFERDVDRLANGQVGGLTVGSEAAKEIVALVRQVEAETSAEPKIWTAYDILTGSRGPGSVGRYQELVRLAAVVEGFFGHAQLHALPLFRSIHQQLALPPALAKKIDAANRYWSKTSLRFTKPAWVKSLRHVSGGRCYGPVLAYENLLKEARKHVALAKEALAAGVSHSAEATKTVLQAGPFRLVNTAHFSDEQMQQIGAVVREAAKRLTDIGLARVCYGDMLMSRQISKSNVLAFYMTKNDEMFVRGDVADNDRRNLLWTICHELGHRLQFEFLSEKGDALIQRFYASTKRQARLAKSEAHYFPAVGTKIETPIGELTFLGRERLGVVAYLDPKGQKRLTTTTAWQASMGAWDRHYGRGAESLFVSHYASKDAYESFAEMVAACATGKAKPAFVATLREILKADSIELLIDTDAPAQRGAEPQASVTPHEYAAITETPEAAERREDRDAMRHQDQLMDEYAAWVAAERKRGAEDVPRFDAWLTSIRAPYRKNPVMLSPTKADWPGKSRGVALSSLPQDELTRGIEHEREHIPNRFVAQRIAADHLVEDPAYYSHLDAMERQQNPRAHDALSLAEVRRWEPLASSSGVSDVARGPSGFLTAYKRAGGRLDRLSEAWRAKREAFIARHMAQAKNERMFDNGLPTRRHLALIMWAYSPEAARLREASPRKANPVDGQRFRFRGRTDDEVPCSLCGTTDKKVTVWLAPVDSDGNDIGEPSPYGRQCAAMLLRKSQKRPTPSQAEAILADASSETARADLEAWHARVRPHAVVIGGYYVLSEDAQAVRDGTMPVTSAALRLQQRFPKPRKANPVDDDPLVLLKEAGGASSKVKWREAGGAREYMIVAHGQAEVRRIAAALTSSGGTVTHDFYADPERGYRALHLRLRGGEPVQVKTARMATLAYAAQGVDAVDDSAFRKLCDLAAYADEGDPHAARRFDEIPVTELRSQIARQNR